jgi:hypothetical protein
METLDLKANVNLEDCHDNFWKLISFLGSVKELSLPRGKFSLTSHDEAEIISALRERGTTSIVSIIKQLSSSPGLSLSQDDINQLLNRKEKLLEFKTGLSEERLGEEWWQSFFEQNKWIFGYGLNYQILRQEQAQPNLGGSRVDGGGGHRGDYLTSTQGTINFTVLVEIKTPRARLLQGVQPIRSGAWSLSRELTDSIAQIEANIDQWTKGSNEPDNRDRLEVEDIFTVQPKGIVVIGSLTELKDMSEPKDRRAKRQTFQRFRKSIHGIDIITFDELYYRAAFIVKQSD